MAMDLSGGLEPQFEYFLTSRPADTNMRDSASLWIMDDGGTLALPRVTIEAIGSRWETPQVQLNLVLADGRTLRVWGEAPAHSPNETGRGSILGAGPLRFECLVPFRRWVMTFEGMAEQSTTAAQMAGELGGKPTKLAFRIEAEMVAPPWVMGGMRDEAAQMLKHSVEGALIGGLRYEQQCRVSGEVRIAEEGYRVAGRGMRVRRQGVRSTAEATGHTLHSALFPSGRAIAAMAFAPRADGSASFNEGFIFLGDGKPVPARIAQAPWMTRLIASGEEVPIVLESEMGTIRIDGKSLLSVFDHHLFEMADTSVLQQGTARYVWDGEETIGLIERCTLRKQLISS